MSNHFHVSRKIIIERRLQALKESGLMEEKTRDFHESLKYL